MWAMSAATSIAKPPPGEKGLEGTAGGPGAVGLDAPVIELWTLDMTGRPAFDLVGGDGGRGGAGGDGGPGGRGADGSPDARGFLWICNDGPGNGGDGGRAGPGGPGGSGGKLFLFAPQVVLTRFEQRISVIVDGGEGGAGGAAGLPGAGGQGGQRGDNANGCDPATERMGGEAGAQGAAGEEGPSGADGVPGSLSLRAITAAGFDRELTRPAIVNLSPHAAPEGDPVSVNGVRFTDGDTVSVGGVRASATVVSENLAAFVVPAAAGGLRQVVVRRSDGTKSNAASFYVRPTVTDHAPARTEPGQLMTVTGTGFADGATVLLDGVDMPEVSVTDAHTLQLRVRRPDSVVSDPDGESVSLSVVLGDRGSDSASNAVPLALSTFQMLVLGDSVAWGQGLATADKFWARTAELIRARDGGIGVYPTVRAHSGAVIGVGATDEAPPIDGEVPTPLPSVMQQWRTHLDEITPERAADVRLVLVSGGINDVSVYRILNPLAGVAELTVDINRRCRDDMIVLLDAILGAFPRARVVVTAYFPILSEDSDLALVDAILIAAGLFLGDITGAVLSGALPASQKARVIGNCRALSDRSLIALTEAVGNVNERRTEPAVFLADPGFQARNAALASDPWLFGVNADLSPQDTEIAGARAASCILAGADRTDRPTCSAHRSDTPTARGGGVRRGHRCGPVSATGIAVRAQ